jgi:2-polyprenyl-6-methoxyphenol hydroxylase-like FAD-dependent oxidoreductase
MPDRHTQVLVVGGSLVGLSTSVLLASYGVPHLVVESHRGTAIHSRAASFHQRTMEIFRSVGLQAEVEDVAAQEFRQGGAIVAVESLGGKELAYFYRSYNDGVEGLSPTDRLFITQVGLEPVLRHRAGSLGAEHLFGTDLVSFETRDDHVVSVIRPHSGGPEEVVISDYLVAADGAHSAVREQLGIPMTGRGSFADCVTIYPDFLPEPAEPADVKAEAGWTGAALIRPDGVIAWKPDVPAAEAAGQLATVLAGLLSRGGT